jgi:carbonic anhydrase
MPHTWDPDSLSPFAAWRRLSEGNRRFCEGRAAHATRTFSADLAVRPQRPFAIILGCSDSRTPVEILFDQGFGDLFVVRIAGNVVAPSVVGSIEFAASQFGTRLVVVLGHTRCGAIAATVDAIRTGNGPASKNIRSITDRISPHIEAALCAGSSPDGGDLLRRLMQDNVRASADHLRHGSRLLEDLVLAGRLAVIPADYELETGRVQFFEGRPDDDGAAQTQPEAQTKEPFEGAMKLEDADASGTGRKPQAQGTK